MSPNFKITYFDMRGRAEPTRLAFVLGDIEFEDDRISIKSKDEWEKAKPNTPYEAVPTLTIRDKEMTMPQSMAMLRYVGKLTGLYPSDDWKAFIVDEVGETITDLFISIYNNAGPDKDKEVLRESRRHFVEEDIPRYWDVLERRVKQYGASPFVLGEEVSTADISIFCLVAVIKQGIIDHVQTNALDHCPTLMNIFKSFLDLPKVQEWYKKHPIPNVTTDDH